MVGREASDEARHAKALYLRRCPTGVTIRGGRRTCSVKEGNDGGGLTCEVLAGERVHNLKRRQNWLPSLPVFMPHAQGRLDESSQDPIVAAGSTMGSSRWTSQKNVSLEGSVPPLILCTAMARWPGWLNMGQLYTRHEIALHQGKLFVGKRSMHMRSCHWFERTFELQVTNTAGHQVCLRFASLSEFRQFRDTLFEPEQWAWVQDSANSARLCNVSGPGDVVALQIDLPPSHA